MQLDAKIPAGPIQDKWDKHRFDMKLVNPANKRKFKVIVVGTGLAGGAAAATFAELAPRWSNAAVLRSTQNRHQLIWDTRTVEALEDWRQSELFDAQERAALDYAEAMTASTRQVEDVIVESLKSHFDVDAIVELTGLIAFQNMSSKFNSALGVPAQGFCRLPDH